MCQYVRAPITQVQKTRDKWKQLHRFLEPSYSTNILLKNLILFDLLKDSVQSILAEIDYYTNKTTKHSCRQNYRHNHEQTPNFLYYL